MKNNYTKKELGRISKIYENETKVKRFFMKIEEWIIGEHLK